MGPVRSRQGMQGPMAVAPSPAMVVPSGENTPRVGHKTLSVRYTPTPKGSFHFAKGPE